ncbi:MAG TPA: hypothetical protein ENG81_01125 [Candidatus Bathyarchaeota archaeon]|nr:hypothetical protein [Candidatus Bathyarchaeota archaeon]
MSISNQKERVREAIKNGTIINDTTLKIFLMTEALKDKIDKDIPAIENVIERLKGDKGESIKGEPGESIKGADGHTPTKEELLSLIKPLIPKPIVPKDGRDGKDAISPVVDTDKIALEATRLATDNLLPSIPTIDQIEKDIPKLGNPIRDSLELLKEDNRISSDAIKGLGKREDALLKRADSILDQRTQFLLAKLSRTNTDLTSLIASLLVAPEDLTSQCDGANIVFTTANSIRAVLWLSLYGGMIIEGIDFEITGDKEITLSTFAPDTSEELLIKYI